MLMKFVSELLQRPWTGIPSDAVVPLQAPVRQQTAKVRSNISELADRAPLLEKPNPHLLLQPGWIFIVEDVEPARRYAEAHLRRLGWKVFSFADAERCIRAMSEFAPEAILMDIGLPDGSGQIMTSRIRRNARFNGMRIVAYTALDAEDRDALTGFDGVIAKPGRPEEFEALLPSPVVYKMAA